MRSVRRADREAREQKRRHRPLFPESRSPRHTVCLVGSWPVRQAGAGFAVILMMCSDRDRVAYPGKALDLASVSCLLSAQVVRERTAADLPMNGSALPFRSLPSFHAWSDDPA